MIKKLASELTVGDYIQTPDGIAYLSRVPADKSRQFTAWYMHPTERREGSVAFQPGEEVEVAASWPDRPWR